MTGFHALVGCRVQVVAPWGVIAVGVLRYDPASSVPWFVLKDDGRECAVWPDEDVVVEV